MVIVWTYSQWLAEPAVYKFMNVAISENLLRQCLVQRFMAYRVQFFEARAANVVKLDEVQLGEGAVLCPFVTLTSNNRIGQHFHANIYSYVEYYCVICGYVTFAPGVICNGIVHVEDYAYIGTGAVIMQAAPVAPLVIGRGAVGMAAVVTNSVPPGVTVLGNPVRVTLN